MSQEPAGQNNAEINVVSNAEDWMALAGELASVFERMNTHALPSFAQLLFVANAVSG